MATLRPLIGSAHCESPTRRKWKRPGPENGTAISETTGDRRQVSESLFCIVLQPGHSGG